MSSLQSIQQGDSVLLHLTIKLADGSVADSTQVQGKPVWYEVGAAEISEAFDTKLLQQTVPSDLAFSLAAKDAFGEGNPDLVHFMEVNQFPPDMALEIGSIVSFTQLNGQSLPGLICDIQGESVKVDFNPPLVGHDLTFELSLLDIKRNG